MTNDHLELHSDRILALGAWIPLCGRLPGPSASAEWASPLCGSRVTVDLVADSGRITACAQAVHHPLTQANVVTTDYSDRATNCPEHEVTAVQVRPSNGPTEW